VNDEWHIRIDQRYLDNAAGAGARAKAEELAAGKGTAQRFLERLFDARTEDRNWRRGAEGEQRVAADLAVLGQRWAVVHDLTIGRKGANLDHLVIGPPGVFALNTKSLTGKLTVYEHAVLQNGHRTDFVPAALRETRTVQHRLSAAAGRTIHAWSDRWSVSGSSRSSVAGLIRAAGEERRRSGHGPTVAAVRQGPAVRQRSGWRPPRLSRRRDGRDPPRGGGSQRHDRRAAARPPACSRWNVGRRARPRLNPVPPDEALVFCHPAGDAWHPDHESQDRSSAAVQPLVVASWGPTSSAAPSTHPCRRRRGPDERRGRAPAR
jgi:hypothetical protein